MASSIHLVCKRLGLSFHGLKLIDPQNLLYRSDSWELSPSDAEQIIGGWVYFHTARTASSEFGGKVYRVDVIQNDIGNRRPTFGIIFQVRREARYRNWRGHHNELAWSGGLVPLSLHHEIARERRIDSADVRRRGRHTPSAAGLISDHRGR
jgi:hypothetical protein